MQLYTEDVYEPEGEAYFGYLRGRYTKRELKELDAAHWDDMEFMVNASVAKSFESKGKWFSAVVVTDGAGSRRRRLFAN